MRPTAGGVAVTRRLRAMGIRDRPIAPRSPWQNGHVERLIGSIRRECLDHVVVLGERHLSNLLASYSTYYNATRTHLALDKDAPLHRPRQTIGRIASVPWLGGLHRQYDDGSQVGTLLDQIDGPIASFTADDAYDQDGVYGEIAERNPDTAVIVPPRSTAVPSRTAETAPTQRDRHLQLIAQRGRTGWQKASGYIITCVPWWKPTSAAGNG